MSCSTKKSLNELFYMSSILTCMVVLIHTGAELLTYYDRGSLFEIIVFYLQKSMAFAVPGFIFLSSFKLFYSKSFNFSAKNYISFIHKRIVKIFIPYSIFALIYYLYFVANDYMAFNLKDMILGIFLKGDISSPFYFVIVIFQFYMLTPVFNIIFKKTSFKLAIPIAIVLNIVVKQFIISNYIHWDIMDFYIRYNDRIFLSYISYWVIGGYAGLFYENFKSIILKYSMNLNLWFALIILGHITLSYFNYTGVLSYRYAETGHLFFCITSILFTYKTSLLLDSLDMKALKNISMEYSRISYYVYLSHVIFIYLIDNAMNDASIEKMYIRWSIRTIMAFIFSGATALILSSPNKNLIYKLKSKSSLKAELEN